MGMTITEKNMARHAGLDVVKPGQIIECHLDAVLMNDITFPPARKEFLKIGKPVFDRHKIYLVPDHFTPNKDIQSATQAKVMRDFVREHGITNYFEVVFLGATEIDLDFNVNVMTDSNGVLMGASGGHSDTAAGAKCTVITCPLIRGRLPMIRDKVATVITPGSSVDVLVTEYGIAINPARTDLIERFKDSNLPIYTIEELQQLAFDLVGKPQDIPVSDKDEDIIAIVEYRDGSIIDVVRKPL